MDRGEALNAMTPTGLHLPQMGARCGLFNALLSAALALGMLVGWASLGHADPAKPMRIVAFGDSLTAGYMLPPQDAFPVQLERALKAEGRAVEVINAGVSGDTTAGGLERFDWAVPEGTDAVILELGANDALRGIDPALSRANLRKILARLRQRNIEVLLAGMSAPRNWGDAYVQAFDRMYPELAAETGAIHYPFFLDGVALRADLNLGDGLHPNGKGVAVIVKAIRPSVEKLIGRVEARRAAAAKG